MDKNRNVHHKKKKKLKPKVRFKFGVVVMIFIFSLAICFLIFMFKSNTDDTFLQTELGSSADETTDSDKYNDSEQDIIADNTESSAITESGITNPVPQSETADESYFSGCCLLTDSTLAGMKGTGFSDDSVFGGNKINVGDVMTAKVESSFGTLSPYEIIKQKKPSILYLMFGKELDSVSADAIITSYTNLISSIKSAVPDVEIYVMQYPPVLYDSDTLTNEMVNDYNNRLLMMCDSLEIYCIDTNTALKSESGKLNESYWSYETLSLSQNGYDKLKEYILTHVVS
ncbi:MAG: hypothetical protein IKK66_05630 [Ruminococcus sp.]|nr:hypothetical protein [Ruminococcus sp.]